MHFSDETKTAHESKEKLMEVNKYVCDDCDTIVFIPKDTGAAQVKVLGCLYCEGYLTKEDEIFTVSEK